MTERAPYGTWTSPITAELVARAGFARYSEITATERAVYWRDARPVEGGRAAIVRKELGAAPEDVTPKGFNVRTRVHEYGGGSYTVFGDTLFFANYADQRLYRQDPGDPPRPITPEPDEPAGARYADGRVTRDGSLLLCVREVRAEPENVNELVAVPTDGDSPPRVIASGHDFYAAPRISRDGRRLAWLTWDHPRMPWNGTELWTAPVASDGSLGDERLVAGGPDEAVVQPEWGPDDALYFVSDRTNWWNLYRERGGAIDALAPRAAEFGGPLWVFGQSWYVFLGDDRILCTFFDDGRDHLAVVHEGRLSEIGLPYTVVTYLSAERGRALFVGASPTRSFRVVSLDVGSGAIEELTDEHDAVDPAFISVPRALEYPTSGDATAHALFYGPHNPNFVAPSDERPPLIVLVHGGPTGHVSGELKLDIQYFTSRGFAVVDVNYGGSTGYGRAYRDRLAGRWGIVDTEDAINAALYLADRGEVDRARTAISGGSAGGWTVLCALVFHDVFAAGANYYGVADLMGFVDDTHKFESRYNDWLVGPWPEAAELWRSRSPINSVDRLSAPVVVLQGLEDEVVPPSQAEQIVDALDRKGIPHAYLAFEGEQHGFRKAETIARAIEAELWFYARVFGFTPADDTEPVDLRHGDALRRGR